MIDYLSLTYFEIVTAIIVFILLTRISAPYGRFLRRGWGPSIQARWAWFVMESPAVLFILLYFVVGSQWSNPVSLVFLVLWQMHYLHRTFIYPFSFGSGNKRFPIILIVFAVTFNSINGYINGYYLFIVRPLDVSWLTDFRFIIGGIIFLGGYIINKHSDKVLRDLKTHDGDGYKIPSHGMFQHVSSAHYFGELMEWFGWAILTWSLPGFAFAIFSAANLIPRALAHHRWYKQNFENYPTSRKAIIPFIW